MALRVTEEARKQIKDDFIFHNQDLVGYMETIIINYWKSFNLLKDRNYLDKIFGGDNVERIAGDILFTLATTESGEKPLQSIAGIIVPSIASSDKYEDRKYAMKVAMEILMLSEPFTKNSYSKNGYLMIESMISNKNLITKNIYLPLEEPTADHKELGSYDWKLDPWADSTIALNVLNSVPIEIIPLEETPEPVPDEYDFSAEVMKQREKAQKQVARQYLAKKYAYKPVYFNWASDYRGRMYSVGL